MPDQKRHHFVPRLHLERFANQEHRVFVRWRDGKAYTTHIDNVAAISGFYNIELPDGQKSQEVEDRLSQVEGDAAGVMTGIDTSGVAPAPGSEERAVLSVYLGLQLMRTPEHRERTLVPREFAAFLGDRLITKELVAQFLEEVHLGFTPQPGEVQGAFEFLGLALARIDDLTSERTMELMLHTAGTITPHLAARHWRIEHEPRGNFITSDTPVTIWKPPSEEDEYKGFGVVDAAEIRFPLDPFKQLVMADRPNPPSKGVDPFRAIRCNRDMALGCHNFVVSHPSMEVQTSQLPLPARRLLLRFNSGPLIREDPNGRAVEQSEVMHLWVPRR